MSITMTLFALGCVAATAVRRREKSDFIATALAIGLALGTSLNAAPLLADETGTPTVQADADADEVSTKPATEDKPSTEDAAEPDVTAAEDLAAPADEPVKEAASQPVEDASPEPRSAADQSPAAQAPDVQTPASQYTSARIEPVTDVTFLDRRGEEPYWLREDWRNEDGTTKTGWEEEDLKLRAVSSGVRLQRQDALAALDEALQETVEDYIDEFLSESRASDSVTFSLDEIRARCLTEEEPFVERVVVTAGQTWQAHTVVKFDESFHEEVHRRWHEVTATKRLIQTGAGAVVVMLLLSTLFGYFRLDTATRGYYTLRLQFATAGTILAIAAASVLAAKWWVPWM